MSTEDGRFDAFAGQYLDVVDSALTASGESTLYFAGLKARFVAQELNHDPLGHVLDFGCGIGLSTRALANVLPNAQITGCDRSRESIAQARSLTPAGPAQPTFLHFDSEQLPFSDGTFDAVFTSCVFHHIDRQDHLQWAQEIRRVLRPGGSFLFFEHNPNNPLTVRVVRRIPFDAGVILLKSGYTLDLLKRARFQTDSARFYFFFPRALGALRPLEKLMHWIPMGAQYYVHARK